MIIVLIHWRIRPDEKSEQAFLDHWRGKNRIEDRTGLIAEFLSSSLPATDLTLPVPIPITWHLDQESLGNFKSYVTAGLWSDVHSFRDQVANYFNDAKPMHEFEKYRRRRVIFEPVHWRIGDAHMPTTDSEGVM